MKIVWHGHSCFRGATGSSVILIDPFLKGNPKLERSSIACGRAFREAGGIKMPTSSLPELRAGAW